MCFFLFPKEAMHQTSWHFMGDKFSLPWSAFVILLFQQTSLPGAKDPGPTHKPTWLKSYTIQKSRGNTSPPSLVHCQWAEPMQVQNLHLPITLLLLRTPCDMVFNPGRDQSRQLAWPVLYRPENLIKISKEQTRQAAVRKYAGRESRSWAANSRLGLL